MKTSLYRHRAADGGLLYVGIASNPVVRTSDHASHSPWFTEISSIEIEWFETRADAIVAERKAILDENPKHNRQRVAPVEVSNLTFEDVSKELIAILDASDETTRTQMINGLSALGVSDPYDVSYLEAYADQYNRGPECARALVGTIKVYLGSVK